MWIWTLGLNKEDKKVEELMVSREEINSEIKMTQIDLKNSQTTKLKKRNSIKIDNIIMLGETENIITTKNNFITKERSLILIKDNKDRTTTEDKVKAIGDKDSMILEDKITKKIAETDSTERITKEI